VRHGKRHLPYTVSTVLGLAAPALAALLLTSTTPGLAAVPVVPVQASTDVELVPHAVGAVGSVPATTRPAVRPVVRRPAPVATRSTSATPKPRRSTAPRTVVRSAPTTTSTSTSRPRSTTSQTAQPWGTDDYPYRTQSDFYAVDRWGFTQRQCVSFAAWRLAQHGHTISNTRDNWGSAYTWDDTARRLGFSVTRTARVGEIAQWNAHESSPYYGKGASRPNGSFAAGGYGHVGYVKYVYSDGSALVEQYNMSGSRAYSVMRVKAPRYLVIR
jgi:surface antigen